MQVVASGVVLAVGLLVALVLDVPGDLRPFGWLLAGLGALGLVVRAMLGPRGDRRSR